MMKKFAYLLTALMLMLLLPVMAQSQSGLRIKPGWSWFPYSNPEPMEINYALSPISPEIGDVVKSQEGGFSAYTADGWSGSLQQLETDNAYHYYSCKDHVVYLVYPDYGTPSVTTAEVTDVNYTTAVCGGTVVTSGGHEIYARGVCYGTNPNPSMGDNMETVSGGLGTFTCTLSGLQSGVTYYVRAYVLIQSGFTFGEQYSFTTKEAPAGCVASLFTINGDGDQVLFSKGNLQYQASSNTWRFAEHQWDFVGSSAEWNVGGNVPGSSNHLIGSDYDGWIDLFGWGTSGYNHGAVCYQPWSYSAFPGDYWAYGNETYSLFDQDGKADWGFNAISNGGNAEGFWRSLKQPEWCYIFEFRTTNSGIRFAKACVNDVNGVILLPDEWNAEWYTLSNANNAAASFNSNVVDSQSWTSVFETAGCIFLPAAGTRGYNYVDELGTKGAYWTSSVYCGSFYCAYGISFNAEQVNVYDNVDQNMGRAVRLVRSTNQTVPVVITGSAEDITLTSATLTGKVVSNGGCPVTEKGICWSTAPEPTIEGMYLQDYNEPDTMAVFAGFLTPNTTYYFRAYAINSIGIAYGEQQTFNTLDMPNGPTGASSGIFTINAEGDQVYFAQGNLQYKPTTNTWRFAEQPYYFIGSDNENAHAQYDGWIDLFGWGTSGYNHGANCYEPWRYASNDENYYAYGVGNYSLNEMSGKADWGYNAISNGGNQENQWRTLSKAEWNYILNQRAFMSGINYAKAQVNGVNGLIIVPDDWLYFGSGFDLYDYNNEQASFDSNVIDSISWANTYGRFGCVFLPEAGSKMGTEYYVSGAAYWSSTINEDMDACCQYFDNYMCFTGTSERAAGFSVRVVRPVEGTITHLPVVTNPVTNVAINTAVCGGDVFSDGSTTITARGLCWSTNEEPTLNDSFIAEGSGAGSFTCILTGLAPNTTYYIRAYRTDANGTLYGNQYVFTTLLMPESPTGSLFGKFTVNSDGDQVQFSQGNVQYHITANQWRFAENQYDVIGEYNDHIDDDYDGWIDLFGWGTSGHNHGANCYQPWSTSEDPADYYAYGSSYAHLYDSDGSADWGSNTFSNGGYNSWRTPRYEEWQYVFRERTTESGILFAKAIVNDVKGVILVPDDWDASYFTFTSPNEGDVIYSTNEIDEATWINDLEAHGCVFLPAGGNRVGRMVNDNLSYGAYWSSSNMDMEWGIGNIDFGEHFFGVDGLTNRYNGYSVRLVMTADDYVSTIVTTQMPAGMSSTTALVGGSVATDGSVTVSTRGICWSTSTKPTINDNYFLIGAGTGSFTDTLRGLTANTTYYVRAFATAGPSVFYGQQFSFVTFGEPLPAPEGALNGLFSIDENERVFFSQGNLQYHLTNETWRFAEHQWDFVGNSDPDHGSLGGNVSGSSNHYIDCMQEGWIDLFGWAMSGYSVGGACYSPWVGSLNDADYYAYGDSLAGLFAYSGKADWGYNPITNGGNQENLWRTLHECEWNYILHYRETPSGILYAKAQVNGVNGLIIFPDFWESAACLIHQPNDSEAPYNSNVFDAAMWTNYLEQLGCMFLPTAGRRSSSVMYSLGAAGCYWTANSPFEFYDGNAYTWALEFGNDYCNVVDHDRLCSGFSVRVARPITGSIFHQSIATNQVTNITDNSAVGGGNIFSDGNPTIEACGICWATHEEPTLHDNHTSEAPGLGNFMSVMTGLAPNTTYYVRAYYIENNFTYFASQRAFTTLRMPASPEGSYFGKFSVDEYGGQVCFSKGNAQYNPSTNEWKFAEHQYDYVGAGNSSIAPNYSGWIDLFGWGTSGFNHGSICYQPWSVSLAIEDYFAYGDGTANLNDNDGTADWGYNAFTNGGGETGQWRTLSKEEWNYILNFRVTESGILYAKATVNGVHGVILFPDDWDSNTYTIGNANSSEASFNSNAIDEQTWTNTLEVHGCIFLPAAGTRAASYASSFNEYGGYWSSSCGGNNYTVYNVAFCEGYLLTGEPLPYYAARSVRVVKSCESSFVLVTTGSLQDVSSTTATLSSEVMFYGSEGVTAMGLCWSTNSNPTLSDNYVTAGNGGGYFSATITGLTPSTSYYVRAYAVVGSNTYYGEPLQFVTIGNIAPAPTGAINGKFTIDYQGHQVYFSQGNLQYQATTDTWRFALHQWDFVGNSDSSYGDVGGTVSGSSNHLIGETYSGWIDLFGWGMSGYPTATGVCYSPWTHSTEFEDYYVYGSVNTNLYDYTGKADWGYNAISNGGNTENIWHTLKKDEWGYVLFERNTPSQIRYANAMVNEVPGIIILPDDWNPAVYAFHNPNMDAGFYSNQIDATTWTNYLETFGCVFLPAAGHRDGNNMYYVGTSGRYWPSSNDSYDPKYIWALTFDDMYTMISDIQARFYGYSVRVVRPVE